MTRITRINYYNILAMLAAACLAVWLFMLSLLHTILEFPLNHRGFMGTGREIKSRLLSTTVK